MAATVKFLRVVNANRLAYRLSRVRKRRDQLILIDLQLIEAGFRHYNVLESPQKELVLPRLQEKPEDHEDHATLRLEFLTDDESLLRA